MAEAAGVAVLHEAGGFETVDNARDGRELFFLAAIEKHAKVNQPLDTPRQSAHASRCVCGDAYRNEEPVFFDAGGHGAGGV